VKGTKDGNGVGVSARLRRAETRWVGIAARPNGTSPRGNHVEDVLLSPLRPARLPREKLPAAPDRPRKCGERR
jgi:hypothetical protein